MISQAVERLILWDLTQSQICNEMAVVPSEVALEGGVQPWLLLEPMVRPVPFLGDRS